MTAAAAERFVVLNMRLLAAAFAVTGTLFIAAPDGVVDTIEDVGESIGSFAAAPSTDLKFWLALGFAYMVVITGIALVVSTDVARYRPLLLVLAAGKVASSLAALAFFVFDADTFVYLLNFVVDASLVGVVLWCWALAARVRA